MGFHFGVVVASWKNFLFRPWRETGGSCAVIFFVQSTNMSLYAVASSLHLRETLPRYPCSRAITSFIRSKKKNRIKKIYTLTYERCPRDKAVTLQQKLTTKYSIIIARRSALPKNENGKKIVAIWTTFPPISEYPINNEVAMTRQLSIH